MVLGSSPVAVTSPSDFTPASSKEFLDIQATIECGFTLKRVRDMIRTYSHTRTAYSTSKPVEIFMGADTDDAIDRLFDTLLQRFQQAVETSYGKGSWFTH